MKKKRNVNFVGKSKGYISEGLGIGGWLVFGVAAVIMMAVTMADAGVIRVNNFRDNWLGNFTTNQELKMASGDNLLWNLTLGGAPNSVKPDYFDGSWHLGLTLDDGTVVGWATNSTKSATGSEGRLIGRYSGLLGSGGRPSHAFLVYDSLGGVGGMGWDINTITGVIGSAQDLLDGDMFFDEMDIIFGSDLVTGGVSNLPIYTSGTAYLPEMTVVIPEPATITLFTLGTFSLFRKRSK